MLSLRRAPAPVLAAYVAELWYLGDAPPHRISASYDRTLKVWDLQTYACLLTHRGDAPYSAVAISATAVVAGDSTGGVWFLDWPP